MYMYLKSVFRLVTCTLSFLMKVVHIFCKDCLWCVDDNNCDLRVKSQGQIYIQLNIPFFESKCGQAHEFLSHMLASKTQTSLCICAVPSEPVMNCS